MKTSNNILVVDDEQAHAMLITELLRRAGYTVASANDPFKALAACKVRTPDLVILDLHMPLMGGMDVFERLRAEDKTSSIPIIFLGNKDKPIPPFKSDETQAEDVIFKPFEPNELLSRVRNLLKVKQLRDELKSKDAQITELQMLDPLTSLKTPRYLNEFLINGLKQGKRYGVPLSVVILEVDQHRELIKAIGKDAADSVIRQLSEILSKAMRDSDIVVRSGEFEFTLALTATPVAGAIEVAERLRNKVAQTAFIVGEMDFNITVSLGLCEYNKSMDDEGKILLSHARAALQQGHLSGGNVTLKAE
ncbi:MAG TPA: response regulator [Oculatellaceae cyanobacterium]